MTATAGDRTTETAPMAATSAQSHAVRRHFGNLRARFWLCFGSMLLSRAIVNGVCEFPSDWDSLMYHDPMIDDWRQHGSLYAPDSAWWWSPGVNELVGLLVAASFSGDYFVPLANLVFVAIWIMAPRSALRSLGAKAWWPDAAAFAVGAHQ